MRNRYRVEWRVLGAWVPVDSFDDYVAADEWACTLLYSEEPSRDRGVRVLDTQLEPGRTDAVVWSVEG